MSVKRLRTSLVFQVREYRARLLPLFLIALLPILFWGATALSISPDAEPVSSEQLSGYSAVIGTISLTEVPERDTWPVDTMLMGVGWALSTAALFSLVGSNARDRRLVMAGFSPREILIARFAILGIVAVFVSLIPTVLLQLTMVTTPTYLVLIWLGSLLMGLVGIGVGLIVGSLFPRQLEGTIVLIGVIGVAVSIPLTTDGSQYLPTFGAQALFTAGRFSSDPIVLGPVVRSIIWTALLTGAAVVLWSRRVRVNRFAAAIQGTAKVASAADE